MNVEQRKKNSKLTEIIVERNSVKTKKTKYKHWGNNATIKYHNFHPLSNYLKMKTTWKIAICSLRITMNIMQPKDLFKK